MRAAVVAAGFVLMATQLATSHAGASPASPSALSPAATALACAARLAAAPAAPCRAVAGSLDTAVKAVFGPGDVVVLDTGGQGVTAGQTFFARRPSAPPSTAAQQPLARRCRPHVGLGPGGFGDRNGGRGLGGPRVRHHRSRRLPRALRGAAVPAAMPAGAPDFERGLTVLFDNDERAVGSPRQDAARGTPGRGGRVPASRSPSSAACTARTGRWRSSVAARCSRCRSGRSSCASTTRMTPCTSWGPRGSPQTLGRRGEPRDVRGHGRAPARGGRPQALPARFSRTGSGRRSPAAAPPRPGRPSPRTGWRSRGPR